MPTRHVSKPSYEASGRSRTRRSRGPRRRTTTDRWRTEHAEPDNLIDFEELRRERVRRARSLHEYEMRSAQTGYAEPETTEHVDDDHQWSNAYEESQASMDEERPHAPAKMGISPCHWGLYALTLLMAIISIPLVYSASTAIALDHYKNTDFFLWRQVGFVVVGVAALFGASRLSTKQLRVAVWGMYAVAFVGLLAIDFTPLGTDLGSGTRRWLKLGPLPPQQFSELAKIALIGVMADFWSRAAGASQKSIWPWFVAALFSLPLIGLVFLQPHLSAALLLFALPLSVAFHAGVPMRQMSKIVLPLLLLAVVVVGLCRAHRMPLLKQYQQDRIAAHFFSDGSDDRGGNYQVLQGLRALERGGVLGAGPGASMYKQGHLPAPHTDFILAVTGEEWGLVGMLALLICYGMLIFFCFQIGHSAHTAFEALLCSGIGTMLSIQVIFNVGVVTGLMPVTGIPLPLLTYGGSGLICTLMGLGLVLSVSRQSDNAAEGQAPAA